MPDEAEAVAAPGSSPPFTRFIANVSLQQKFDTRGNLAANWKKMNTDLESIRNCHWVGQTTFNASRRHVYHVYLSSKSLFKEKVHAILLKIFEAQDSYADLNTTIKKILAPAYPNSCLDSLISIFLMTDPFYYKYGTLLFISTIVKKS